MGGSKKVVTSTFEKNTADFSMDVSCEKFPIDFERQKTAPEIWLVPTFGFDSRGYVLGKEVCNKKWTGRPNTKFSVNIGPTETYYLPNQWKLNDNFAKLSRFEIAALIG